MATVTHKEVKLSDIKPNPFRRLDLYPLDKLKIEKLRVSIKRTSFWENTVAREKNGHYELAYGHHRIESARQEIGLTAKVRLIIRVLSDEAMLKMMAADNDDAYNITPSFILETVQAAKGFIPQQGTGRARAPAKLKSKISELLAWPIKRVEDALAQLAAIDRNELSRKAIEKLPSQRAARALHQEVQNAKKTGRPLSKDRQELVVKKITQQQPNVTDHQTRTAIRAAVYTPKKPIIVQEDEFLKLIQDGASRASVLDNILKSLLKEPSASLDAPGATFSAGSMSTMDLMR